MSRTDLRVRVRGGELGGGEWNGDAPGLPILAVHGITATHRVWDLVAGRLPAHRVIAPDLRGRGRSNALPAPFGFAAHADDLAALLDARGIDRALVVGHSMGAFVSVRFAERHPDRVAGLVLVDGGLPIALPDTIAPEEVPAHLLGPALERLAMTFGTAEEYVDFWRGHPALGPYWNESIADYARYDLDGAAPVLRSSARAAAVAEDARGLDGSDRYEEALAGLPGTVLLLRAPRGLLDGEPLYTASQAGGWAARVPQLDVREIPDTNHYTILMTPDGARATAEAVLERWTATS
ncbi:pimeloyl-ACP methyl ester carboxylesterase [Microbacterium resistens]|uniref:Pimeloyl-ACP methyl ester carboxylesterase n=1 Tax=Microbacterium resistens TaxID=156977 RepID=A0ABU1S8G5_9MICO|nr:alpha/beta hydrolase [Microbacterium resistens]MDR6865907.1 pimeloyl-ACP methyl ester carboxylesterase [Microbacterium resistens]